jgi:hypothetical protein
MAYKDPADAKKWREANRERCNKKQREWYRKNIDRLIVRNREYARAYDRANPEKRRQYTKAKRISRRERIFSAYGNRCICCGETRHIFLCLDHINNDGAVERRALGISNTRSGNADKVYYKVIRDGFPKDRYQLLCHNCNWAKSHGGCPHKESSLQLWQWPVA